MIHPATGPVAGLVLSIAALLAIGLTIAAVYRKEHHR